MISRLINALTATEKKLLQGAAVVFVVGAIIAAALWVQRATTLVPDVGGTYTEGFVGQPTMLNPILSGGSAIDRDMIALLYSDLGTLAERVTASDNGRVWEVALGEGTRWSDGEPIVAADILYTIETIQDPRTGSPYFQTWQGVVVERVSERSIKVTLKTPYAFLEDNFRELRIIPQHIFGNIPNANLRLSEYNLEPIGSGPYMFAKFEKRKDGFITSYTTTRNPYYVKAAPYIDAIVLKFFTDSDELLRAFNKRTIDGFGGQDSVITKRIDAKFVATDLAIPRYYALFENQGITQALKNIVVRKALRGAVNRPRLIETVFRGHATPVYGPLLPESESYNAMLYTQEQFSIDASIKLLEDDGWTIGADGVREKALGKKMIRLEFEMLVPQIQFLVDTASIIKDDWAKIGVKLIVVPIAPDELNDGAIKTRNYQLLIFGNLLKNNPDIFAFWHSSERFYPGLNLALYDNKKVDGLLESIRKMMTKEERNANIEKLQELIWNDAPAIFLFSPSYQYIVTPQLQGIKIDRPGTPADRFRFVNEWYLDTKRVFK